jgi:uncharacterized Zn finger protein (UPF0148 family)
MADLLRKGYTMLNLACPNCKNPIFRSKSGDMICPKCNKPVIFSEEINNLPDNKNEPKIENVKKHYDSLNDMGDLSFLYDVTLEKLNLIANQLHKETEMSKFNNYIKNLQKFLEILYQIQKIKKT